MFNPTFRLSEGLEISWRSLRDHPGQCPVCVPLDLTAEKVWDFIPKFIPGAGGRHETPWFPPKDPKNPEGVGGMEGAKPGLELEI